jgi:hypothetical protein
MIDKHNGAFQRVAAHIAWAGLQSGSQKPALYWTHQENFLWRACGGVVHSEKHDRLVQSEAQLK